MKTLYAKSEQAVFDAAEKILNGTTPLVGSLSKEYVDRSCCEPAPCILCNYVTDDFRFFVEETYTTNGKLINILIQALPFTKPYINSVVYIVRSNYKGVHAINDNYIKKARKQLRICKGGV